MQYSKKPYRHKHNIDNLAGILNISEEKKEDLKKLIFKSNINFKFINRESLTL